jgi:hypothetical protein
VALSRAPSDPLVAMLEVLGWSAEDYNQLCKSLKIRHRIFTLSLGGHFSLIIDR